MTKIDWCDETINPQGWGCWGPGGTPEKPQRCWYCYLKRLQKWPRSKCELCQQLIPHWHPERLDQPLRWRKPRRIFWGSTSDLFHPYTPESHIIDVQVVAEFAHWHTHIFCTKNPARYAEFNPWPANCILLTTCETQKAADERIPELLQAQASVRGVSLEPLGGSIDFTKYWGLPFERQGSSLLMGHPLLRRIQLIIVGAMTGPAAIQNRPFPGTVQNLIDQARAAGVPIFLKDNLNWPEKIQEWPG